MNYLKLYPIRVTLDFGGYQMVLDGAEARKWSDACDAQTGFCLIHGVEFPALEWQRVDKARSEAQEG